GAVDGNSLAQGLQLPQAVLAEADEVIGEEGGRGDDQHGAAADQDGPHEGPAQRCGCGRTHRASVPPAVTISAGRSRLELIVSPGGRAAARLIRRRMRLRSLTISLITPRRAESGRSDSVSVPVRAVADSRPGNCAACELPMNRIWPDP